MHWACPWMSLQVSLMFPDATFQEDQPWPRHRLFAFQSVPVHLPRLPLMLLLLATLFTIFTITIFFAFTYLRLLLRRAGQVYPRCCRLLSMPPGLWSMAPRCDVTALFHVIRVYIFLPPFTTKVLFPWETLLSPHFVYAYLCILACPQIGPHSDVVGRSWSLLMRGIHRILATFGA